LYVSRDRIWGKSLVIAKIAPATAPNTTPAISINKISALFLFFDSNSGLHSFAKMMKIKILRGLRGKIYLYLSN
jgi:hypothetical protein